MNRLRLMHRDDLPSVVELQNDAYISVLPEDVRVFENRLQLSPASCWVCENDGDILGYLISHPWVRGTAPTLNAVLPVLPEWPNTLFIHDCAVNARARGQGIARTLVTAAFGFARRHGFPCLSLVAVQYSTTFWKEFGFCCTQADRRVAPQYGEDAEYMELELMHGV
jgi:GNAT superfamily N-acetyltransferase